MKWILMLVCILPGVLSAAEIEVLKQDGEFYTLKIDNKIYRAMSDGFYQALQAGVKGESQALQKQVLDLQKALNKSREEVAKYESLRKDQLAVNQQYQTLTRDFGQLNTEYSNVSKDLVALNKDYKQGIEDFDKLVDKYRDVALRTIPRSSLDLGVGMLTTGGTSHSFLMAGTGLKLIKTELRGWVFYGTDNYGAMVGVSF